MGTLTGASLEHRISGVCDCKEGSIRLTSTQQVACEIDGCAATHATISLLTLLHGRVVRAIEGYMIYAAAQTMLDHGVSLGETDPQYRDQPTEELALPELVAAGAS